MTKKQAIVFAKMYSAMMISYTDAFCFMDNDGNMTNVPERYQQKMVDACNDIAYKMLGSLPEIGTAPEIYQYVLKNH